MNRHSARGSRNDEANWKNLGWKKKDFASDKMVHDNVTDHWKCSNGFCEWLKGQSAGLVLAMRSITS